MKSRRSAGTRRSPGGPGLTIPGSVMVATLTVTFIAAGVLVAAIVSGPVMRLVSGGDDTAASPSPSASTTATPDDATPDESEPTEEPEESDDADDEPDRDMPVAVLNNTGAQGRAAELADTARDSDWDVTDVDNWRGQVPATTVYYPSGEKEQAELLAEDLDIDRVQPASGQMKSDRLTVIIAGGQ